MIKALLFKNQPHNGDMNPNEEYGTMKTCVKVMVIVLLVILPIHLFAQPYEGQKGDVDNDGNINVLDMLSIANHILGIAMLDEQGLWRADLDGPVENCDGDGNTNVLDMIKIANIILGTDECPSVTVTDIDGNVYKTVTIGDQVWMAENLKVTHYRNGDPILNVTSESEWETLTSGAYCHYDNDIENVATYGRLYNWYAVDDSRNIAPSGWHVPTDAEWKQLEMALGMSQSEADDTGWRGTNEGSKLAGNASLWASGDLKNNAGFGTSGFTALPGGVRHSDGTFDGLGHYAPFWSATEYSMNSAWYRSFHCNGAQIGRSYDHVEEPGFSVRCVRDN
jgi:uncharacterized protein (TIGR02145 family)